MIKFVNLFLLLVLIPKIVFGQVPGTEKYGPPTRLEYLGEAGVFLNKLQEAKTLDLFLLLDKYENNTVAQYFINYELLTRVKELEERKKECENDLFVAEADVFKTRSNLNHYIALYKSIEAENKILVKNKKQLPLYKAGTFVFITSTLILSMKIILINGSN